ncbi:uncharacterized protein MELLADRAFT_104945 [Melampsora larici-populina 98AG31]|uniref:Uncharacterized protein n=1 Tax=Melampsora larici-populina (strain 98AG31 / pathotype 3-4-7) TaxID=747676 RepID=F4RGL2_MELLP|nr:uncharacterized protein MELLADRAFT_104945 [Melampsora larici-populina 98AG31]EGG08629.1 hypothetical protein MELLADRAFT_104945 [Melampsora larici-populina 98AG31]
MIPTASFYFPNPGGLDMGIGPEIFNAPYVPPGSVNVPEFTTETHKTVSNAHDENGFADLTHPQLAAVVGGSVAISTALVALGRLGYRAYLKYGRKPTIPESKTSDLEMAEPGAITSVSKVDKPSAPLDTIGDMRDQFYVEDVCYAKIQYGCGDVLRPTQEEFVSLRQGTKISATGSDQPRYQGDSSILRESLKLSILKLLGLSLQEVFVWNDPRADGQSIFEKRYCSFVRIADPRDEIHYPYSGLSRYKVEGLTVDSTLQ